MKMTSKKKGVKGLMAVIGMRINSKISKEVVKMKMTKKTAGIIKELTVTMILKMRMKRNQKKVKNYKIMKMNIHR